MVPWPVAPTAEPWITEPLNLSHPSGDQASHNVTDYGLHPTNSAVQFICTRG
jgi:hypothetical protein